MNLRKICVLAGLSLLLAGCADTKLDVNLDSLDVKPVESLNDGTEYAWTAENDSENYADSSNLDDENSGSFGSHVVDEEFLQESTEMETETEKKNTESTESTETGSSETQEKKINLVVFGNSVTCNEISDLWKSTWGMAASAESADYEHLVKDWLENNGYKVNLTIAGIKNWEVASDRGAEVDALLAAVSNETDIILIQTGENITEHKDTLAADYLGLFNRIKSSAPNAEVIVLAELLWPKEDIESAKIDACAKSGFTFLSMDEFLAGYESNYKSAVGTVVKAQDGSNFVIENEVVAAHPNDEGMKKIAEIIQNHLKSKLQ